ncbi:MAG: glycosyl hydrolase family 65 protein [Planctomycetota bacterium]
MTVASLKSPREDRQKDEYGHFLDDFSFELNDPGTPRPWANLLSNDEYLLSITQLGSGFSCYKSVSGNLVTPHTDFDETNYGRFFYIRNRHTSRLFSPTIYPVHAELGEYSGYSCVYSPGTMEWKLRFGDTSSRLATLVCPDENTELHLLELTNHSKEKQIFDCFMYLEWKFGGATNEWGKTIYAGFNKDINALVADLNVPPEYRFCQTGFITATERILDYDCRRLAFIGTLGSVSQPEAVRRGKCFCTQGPELGTTCGAVRVNIELPPSRSIKIMFAVGVAENVAALNTIVPKYNNDVALFEKNLEKVKAGMTEVFAKQHIQAPIENLTRFCDTWLKWQVIQNARWTRWAMDKGYRDVMQDSAGLRLLDACRAKKMIIEAVKHQKSNGHAPRQWSNVPFGKTDWRDYRDSCFWLIYGLDAYLRETGDYQFLKENSPFIDSEKQADVWTHADLAIDYLWQQRGSHGLCLIGHGDWLDSMNRAGLRGKGESVWLTQAYCWALLRMIELAKVISKPQSMEEYKKRYDQLRKTINDTAWDGNWYLKGYNDKGQIIGSAKCPDGGKMFLNPQSWAVISCTAPPERIKSAFKAVEQYLATPAGPLLYTPRYEKYDPEIGRITIGSSESDAVYVHAATFKIMADLMLGNGSEAYETLRKIIPAERYLPASQTGAEPFCCVNAYAGPGWPWPGWSYVGWWTATADWVLQAVVEWLYGVRAEHEGLKIDPTLPPDWKHAKISRYFRNAWYDVTITKPAGICKGKVTLRLDGKPIQGDIIPSLADGKRHQITCLIEK